MNILRLAPLFLIPQAFADQDPLKLADVLVTANRQVEDRAQTSAIFGYREEGQSWQLAVTWTPAL